MMFVATTGPTAARLLGALHVEDPNDLTVLIGQFDRQPRAPSALVRQLTPHRSAIMARRARLSLG